jgi:hypothetical protein
MSDTGRCWPELYRQAILESDRGRLPAWIEEASEAIRRRSRELWYAGSPESRERRDLDSALRFLGLLRMVGAEK